MIKRKTIALPQAVAAARLQAKALAHNDDYARVAYESHLLSSVAIGLGVSKATLEPLSVVVPRNAFERTCIGCGAKVIPGLTDHCNH